MQSNERPSCPHSVHQNLLKAQNKIYKLLGAAQHLKFFLSPGLAEKLQFSGFSAQINLDLGFFIFYVLFTFPNASM
jgi:hypothetical protein